MMPIDVYRIGSMPKPLRRLQRRLVPPGATPQPRWRTRLWLLIDRCPLRRTYVNDRPRLWGPRWQAEWPDCEHAVRGWTAAGARRRAIRELTS